MTRFNLTQRLPIWQVILLFFTIGIGGLKILNSAQTALGITFLLFCTITILGLILCRRTQVALNDTSLSVLGYYWLIKLLITFFLLHISWIHILNTDTQYDPVRYYYQSKDFSDNNFSIDVLNINYTGIIYYYGIIFRYIGHNPFIPAIINSFITLLASLYLMRVGYEIRTCRKSSDWTLALLILAPEIIWYDTLTSRETLMGSLMVFALLPVGRYLLNVKSISIFKVFLLCGMSMLAIAVVRTSMLVPVFLAILFMILFIRTKTTISSNHNFIAVGVLGFALTFGLFIGLTNFNESGDITSKLIEALGTVASAKDNIASSEHVQYSENSISLLLMPDNIFQAILYLPPRMVAYLLTPLPNLIGPFIDVFFGKFESWQVVLTILSSIFNLFAFPCALGGLIYTIMKKNEKSSLIFYIPFWCIFIAIAGGNLIIHERYRVMATFFLIGSFWLSLRVCPRNFLVKTLMFWYGSLALFSLPYMLYKL